MEQGLKEISNLTTIQHLKLGPSVNGIKINGELFVKYLSPLCVGLITLQLIDVKTLTDELIGEILDQSLQLEQLSLIDMEFGTISVEAMSSNIPNLSILELIGSDKLEDIDVRCIASVCRHLTSLTFSRCKRLTDLGFVRCQNLKMLTLLNISKLSKNCTGDILKYFTLCPLKSLTLEGIKLSAALQMSFLHYSTYLNLKYISLRDCSSVSKEDVMYILHTFIGCKDLDMTGCNTSLETLKSLPHWNPFLTFHQFPTEYVGFKLSFDDQIRYVKFWNIIEGYYYLYYKYYYCYHY